MKEPLIGLALDSEEQAAHRLLAALAERDREIDVLKIQSATYLKRLEDAEGRALRLQEMLDRHMENCGRDEASIQRLIRDLSEAGVRRKEQVAMIARRDQIIAELRAEAGHHSPQRSAGRSLGGFFRKLVRH